MQDAHRARANEPALPARLRRLVRFIRTEGGGSGRESAAIASGIFIGCLPFYGFHLLICGAVGTFFRLNRLKMYLAANISNPFVAPWLVFLEIQAGAWLRRGAFHPLTVEAVKTTSPAIFATDLLIGSVAMGAVLAGLAAWLTYALVRGSDDRHAFTELVRLASDRYINAGLLAWEFARGKLRADPVYKASVCGGLLTRASNEPVPAGGGGSGGTLLDVGCGLGLTLALLAEARRAWRAGTWPPDWPAPPCFERMVGIEVRGRVAAIASAALAGEAEVINADADTVAPFPVDAVLLFDVLHMMGTKEQEALLASMAAALTEDGRLLIREADAAAGWRFTTVRWGNRLKALLFGSWRQQFHYRTASEWQACLVRHNLRADVREMGGGTPFANVLFLVTKLRLKPTRTSKPLGR